MPGFSLDEFISRAYLLPLEPDGQYFRAKIVKAIIDKDNDINKHPDKVQFLISKNNSTQEDIVVYNDIIGHIDTKFDENSGRDNCLYNFWDIIAYQGPLVSTDKIIKIPGSIFFRVGDKRDYI